MGVFKDMFGLKTEKVVSQTEAIAADDAVLETTVEPTTVKKSALRSPFAEDPSKTPSSIPPGLSFAQNIRHSRD